LDVEPLPYFLYGIIVTRMPVGSTTLDGHFLFLYFCNSTIKTMNNIRSNIKRDFTTIPNALINDNELTDRARFLFCYMAAKPDDWKFYQNKISKDLKLSIETIRKYISELDESGWLSRELVRSEGKFDSYDYTLNNSPCRKNTDTVKNRHGKKPTRENLVLTNEIPLQKNNITNKEENKVVELHSTVTLVDEVDETMVEIHHVPEYFDTEQKKPKEKVAQKRKGKETTAEEMDLVFQVVQYLNEKTEQSFQTGGEKTKLLILARHHGDKWNLDDFKTVIDHKKSEWFPKDNLRQYLRPSTLFAAGHAEEYLQAAKLWKKKPVATSPGVVPLYRQENYQNVDKSKFKF